MTNNPATSNRICVGIDIGTTTVSGVCYDLDKKLQLEAYSVPHNSYTKTGLFSEQSVSVILETVFELLNGFTDKYKNIVSIGLTGQMHGIVYINKHGEAVSDLINWQDKRADQPLKEGKSAVVLLKEITGETV